jgi:hypothetical protein
MRDDDDDEIDEAREVRPMTNQQDIITDAEAESWKEGDAEDRTLVVFRLVQERGKLLRMLEDQLSMVAGDDILEAGHCADCDKIIEAQSYLKAVRGE